MLDNTLTAPPTPTNISVNLIPSTSIASTTTTSNTSSTVSSSAPSAPCPHAANVMAAANCEAAATIMGGTPKSTRKRSVEANRSISINKPMGFYHSSSEDQSVNSSVANIFISCQHWLKSLLKIQFVAFYNKISL